MKPQTKIVILGALAIGGYFLLKKPAAAAPVYSPPVDPSGGIPSDAVYDPYTGKLIDNTYHPTPNVYTTSAPVPVVVDNVRDGYMRSLKGYITDPAYVSAFEAMTNDELAAAWYYVGTYLSQGIPLLDATAWKNGAWDNSNPGNPGLYSKIQAIKIKYHIF